MKMIFYLTDEEDLCMIDKLCKWKTVASTGINAIAKMEATLTNKEMTKVLFLNGLDVKMEWLVRTLKIWNSWMKFKAKNPIVEATASLYRFLPTIKIAMTIKACKIP